MLFLSKLLGVPSTWAFAYTEAISSRQSCQQVLFGWGHSMHCHLRCNGFNFQHCLWATGLSLESQTWPYLTQCDESLLGSTWESDMVVHDPMCWKPSWVLFIRLGFRSIWMMVHLLHLVWLCCLNLHDYIVDCAAEFWNVGAQEGLDLIYG